MTTAINIVLAIVALGALFTLLPVAIEAYRKHRGTRLVTCPETHQPAAVEINAAQAVASALAGEAHLRLRACSRWPERQHCGQACLKQIDAAPQGCLVRTILSAWFHERSCALCAAPFDAIESWGHQSALLSPSGVTVEWGDVPAETLPELLTTHRPVCWNCHVAESFRRQHPELVVERSHTVH